MLLTKDDAVAMHCKFYLNGEDVTRTLAVVEANEEAGYLQCLEMAPLPEGVDPATTTFRHYVIGDNGPVTFMLRGIVVIEVPEDKKHWIGVKRSSQRVRLETEYDPEDSSKRSVLSEHVRALGAFNPQG